MLDSVRREKIPSQDVGFSPERRSIIKMLDSVREKIPSQAVGFSPREDPKSRLTVGFSPREDPKSRLTVGFSPREDP